MNPISTSRLGDQLSDRMMKALISSIVMLTLAGTAHAAQKSEDCKPKGKPTPTMMGTVYWNPAKGGYWVERVSFTIQDNLERRNNVYIRLRGDGGKKTYWAWTSGDDIKGEQTYTKDVNEFVPHTVKPYVKFQVTFDLDKRPDLGCPIYIELK